VKKKKIFLIIIGAIVVIWIFAYFIFTQLQSPIKLLSYEQTQNNFVHYEEILTDIIKKYNYEFELRETDIDLFKRIIVTINNNLAMGIHLTGRATESEKGTERIWLLYSNKQTSEDLNIEFFVELVNAISAEKITKDFLSDKNIEWEDISMDSQEFRKMAILNTWWEDYNYLCSMTYALGEDYEQIHFECLTYNSIK